MSIPVDLTRRLLYFKHSLSQVRARSINWVSLVRTSLTPMREPPNGAIVKSTLEVSNKGITISFGKFCNSIPFNKEYSKGSMDLVYVEDLGLRGGFGINITKG